MTQTPHLFTKAETDDLSDDNVLNLVVKVVTSIYDEGHVGTDEYIAQLVETGQRLGGSLLSLDYEEMGFSV